MKYNAQAAAHRKNIYKIGGEKPLTLCIIIPFNIAAACGEVWNDR